jgi:hypothetical protein
MAQQTAARHGENVLMRRAMQMPELRSVYYDALLAEPVQPAVEGEPHTTRRTTALRVKDERIEPGHRADV